MGRPIRAVRQATQVPANGSRPRRSQSAHRCVDHLKHRAVLLTLYSAGLRLTEATNLKAQHIDSQRMQIKIVKGKGNRDRFVPLSPRLLHVLREY
ncbi:MAG: tyrosine-type recombinase/integrase [Pirellula sp.]